MCCLPQSRSWGRQQTLQAWVGQAEATRGVCLRERGARTSSTLAHELGRQPHTPRRTFKRRRQLCPIRRCPSRITSQSSLRQRWWVEASVRGCGPHLLGDERAVQRDADQYVARQYVARGRQPTQPLSPLRREPRRPLALTPSGPTSVGATCGNYPPRGAGWSVRYDGPPEGEHSSPYPTRRIPRTCPDRTCPTHHIERSWRNGARRTIQPASAVLAQPCTQRCPFRALVAGSLVRHVDELMKSTSVHART